MRHYDLVLAIDPGPEQSGIVMFNGSFPEYAEILPNQQVLDLILNKSHGLYALAVEKIESFGMAVGASTFETVWWSGRFEEAYQSRHLREGYRIGRKAIKIHLCGSTRAKDANIRQALIDRLGAPGSTQRPKLNADGGLVFKKFGPQKGLPVTEKIPNNMSKIRSHCWAALAVAVTWWDTENQELA